MNLNDAICLTTNFQIEIHCKKHSYLDIKIKEIDTKDIPDDYPRSSDHYNIVT